MTAQTRLSLPERGVTPRTDGESRRFFVVIASQKRIVTCAPRRAVTRDSPNRPCSHRDVDRTSLTPLLLPLAPLVVVLGRRSALCPAGVVSGIRRAFGGTLSGSCQCAILCRCACRRCQVLSDAQDQAGNWLRGRLWSSRIETLRKY
jgi:hypothetical protein